MPHVTNYDQRFVALWHHFGIGLARYPTPPPKVVVAGAAVLGALSLSFTVSYDQNESRGPRAGGPKLFVVVANTRRPDLLEDGLSRLLPTARWYGAQILVVGAATPNRVYELTREHAGIRYIMAANGLSRADLLSLGVAETGGGVVVLTDETGLAEEDWPELLSLRLGRDDLRERARRAQNEISA